MKKFGEIDGLRGWLAWCVVASHIILFSGSVKLVPGAYLIAGKLADNAVLIFIIISGFVITHLIMTKPEPYASYLTRRALRLYPVYLVALAAGVAGTHLAFTTFLPLPFGPLSPPIDRMAHQQAELSSGHLLAHLLAHLTMLHGAISSNILFESQYMFLAPAWSLSLEWQFYVVAPIIVVSALHARWRWALIMVTIVLYAMYRRGILGSFILPSFLPGAAPFFAVGIITRLAAGCGRRTLIACVCAIFAVLVGSGRSGVAPVAVWITFMASLKVERGPAHVAMKAFFGSKVARWMGDHSYSVYMIHVPIVQILTWTAVTQAHLTSAQTLAFVAPATVACVLPASAMTRRYVEVPGIRLGKYLTNFLAARRPGQMGVSQPLANDVAAG